MKILQSLKESAKLLRASTGEKRNQALDGLTRELGNRQDEILRANAEDLKALPPETAEAFRDRLTLTPSRIAQMQESLRQVVALADPVGEQTEERRLPNGLLLKRVRSPLGVIFLIFESRPNVAIEAFSLAFKAGNAMILRGGKESRHTTTVLYQLIRDALERAGLPASCLWGITDPDRALLETLLKQTGSIDVVVPRGGEGLIRFVTEHSRIPILKNDRGLCHVYVHEDADLAMAEAIVENAKTQRPGVCNAMETLLVHERVAQDFLPALYASLRHAKVRWRVCPRTLQILFGKPGIAAAATEDWDTEHLSLIMNVRVVESLDQAISHIETHGSRHSEAILTSSEESARKFQAEIDAAAVYWNASTRFTDGFEFGLGGELGISTQKLHARGPVGLRELTSIRWIIDGKGQTRK